MLASRYHCMQRHDHWGSFMQVFLRDCIVHGVLLSLNKDSSKHFASDSVQSTPQHSLMHPLLLVYLQHSGIA